MPVFGRPSRMVSVGHGESHDVRLGPKARTPLVLLITLRHRVGEPTVHASGEGLCPGWRLCGAEERRGRAGARSALRELTRGICLSGMREAHAASYAARPGPEHRREPLAQRGALQ